MLLNKLTRDMHQAVKSDNKLRLSTLRYLVAAIKKFQIDTYLPGSPTNLTDADVEKIIRKQVKNHHESITAFKKGNREDLVQKESLELDILLEYLPKDLSEEEIRRVVKKVIGSGKSNFGQVMGTVMKEFKGKADGTRVLEIVKEELQKLSDQQIIQ